MYQYKIEKVLKLKGNHLQAVLDLGFGIQVTKTFELDRMDEPELDFATSVSDPEISIRAFIIQWLKTSPRPLYVHMNKVRGDYRGEVLDKNGNNLADDFSSSPSFTDETKVISYAPPPSATADPTSF
jgi:hypothetical protein